MKMIGGDGRDVDCELKFRLSNQCDGLRFHRLLE